MTCRTLTLLAGIALAASVGAAAAAEPGAQSRAPDILVAINGAAYETLSTDQMAKTVGTSHPCSIDSICLPHFYPRPPWKWPIDPVEPVDPLPIDPEPIAYPVDPILYPVDPIPIEPVYETQ